MGYGCVRIRERGEVKNGESGNRGTSSVMGELKVHHPYTEDI